MSLKQATSRLQAVKNSLDGKSETKVILPDLTVVNLSADYIILGGTPIAKVTQLQQTLSLAISAIGTKYEDSNPMPKYHVIEISTASSTQLITPELCWIVIYTLFSWRTGQEMIPIDIMKLENHEELSGYILKSGLGRRHPRPTEILFLSRSAFWQGAGTSGHHRGWLREYTDVVANFPVVESFTRNQNVITSHPLRPPKPPPGALLYRRYCPSVDQVFELHYIDVENARHLDAFHRWHNDERVNAGWGEAGTMEQHRKYIREKHEDPRVWAVLGSWDGDLMGYFEMTWVKEDHVAQYMPDGPHPFDRGIHIAVGEEKYRGRVRARLWFCSVFHYMFISEPRTLAVVGEPNIDNAAVIAVSLQAEMHLATDFDFPYKRSTMTHSLRERFFKRNVLP